MTVMRDLVHLVSDCIYDKRVRAVFYQAIASAMVVMGALLSFNAVGHNFSQQHIATGFAYLNREAGFLISQSFIDYRPSDTYGRALLVGLLNTIVVSCLGVVLATLIGFLVGAAKLATNPVLGLLARFYVETLRSVPLLLWLFFWYALFLTHLPPPRDAWEMLPHTFLSNGGLSIPGLHWTNIDSSIFLWCFAGFALSVLLNRLYRWRFGKSTKAWLILLLVAPVIAIAILQPELSLDLPAKAKFRIVGGMRLTTEFTALLVGISLSASAAVAEIVRAGIRAIDAGQRDAALALGLSRPQMLRLIILPQALKLMAPPLAGIYLSLFKSSSLAVAIGYPDLVMVSNTTMNQTGQALECIAVYMSTYLIISLSIGIVVRRFGRINKR